MLIRHAYLDKLIAFKDTDFIKVITGVRRSGKSVLLQQYASYLREQGIADENIIDISLESFEYQNVTTAEDLTALLSERIERRKTSHHSDSRIYLLLDEIQYVDGWQKVINGLRVSLNCDIVITGSNAKLLSGELATLLSGRYVEIMVYPFSFKEYLESQGIDPQSRAVDEAYRVYERYGGFPAVASLPEDMKDMVLSGIYDSIILNDIAMRGAVRDTTALKRFVSFLADNSGQMVNATTIANVLKSEKLAITYHTVQRYLELLRDAYLFHEVRPYDLRGKAYLWQNAKYFIVDNGLRGHAVDYRSGNNGNRLENIVCIELLRRGYTLDVARIGEKEVDFVARKNGVTEYYQVAYQLPENSHETDNLLLIQDNFRKCVITGRYAGVDNVDGVEVRYVVDWLLEE